MTAKEYLRQVYTSKRRIKRLNEIHTEIINAMHMISSPSMGERVQTSPRDRMPELMARLDRNDAKLLLEMEREQKVIVLISQQVEGLKATENEREVLHMRYILCMSWDKIIAAMPYTDRRVYQIHGLALQAFDKQYLQKRFQ